MKLLLAVLAVAPCAAHRLRSVPSPADDGAWWAEHDGDKNVQTEHRHLQSDLTNFQLKIYWEEGYFWQEEDVERRWCLECDGSSCGIDATLHIQECDENESKQRFVYEAVPGTGGGRLKPYDNQDLCWQRTGPNEHTLQDCGTSCRQIIKGIQYIGRFEMHPNGRPDECLEQHHHPKADEVVRASDCESSRRDTTSYWIMINKEGSADWEESLPPENQFINNFGRGVCGEDYLCGLCQGQCETDDDCKGVLQCFARDGNEAIPGCLETSSDQASGLNFCYDPLGTYVIPPAPAPTDSVFPPFLTDNCEEPNDAETTTPEAAITTSVVEATTYQFATTTLDVVDTTTPEAATMTSVVEATTPQFATTTLDVVDTTTPEAATTTSVVETTAPQFVTTTLDAVETTAPPFVTTTLDVVETTTPGPAATTLDAVETTTAEAATTTPAITSTPLPTTTTTTTTTITTSTTTSTTTDPCDLSTDGFYGTKGSKVSTIGFYFELEISTSGNDTVDDVVSVLERDFLRSLLPDLFGVDCAAPTRRLRGLAGVPLGASIGPGIMPVDGANCLGTFNDANNCTVFVDNMVIYSESDEDYVEFVVTRLKESMAKGEFDGAHPAIVRTTFLGQLTTEAQPVDSTSAVENGGLDRLPLLYVIPCVAVVVLIVAGFVWKRRRDQRKRAVDTVSVDSYPSDCQDKRHQSPARSPIESAPISSLAIPSPCPTRPALPGHTCTPSICSSFESSSGFSGPRAKRPPPPVHRSRSSVRRDAKTVTKSKSNTVPSDSMKSADETILVPPICPARAPSLENYYAHMQAQSEKWYLEP